MHKEDADLIYVGLTRSARDYFRKITRNGRALRESPNRVEVSDYASNGMPIRSAGKSKPLNTETQLSTK